MRFTVTPLGGARSVLRREVEGILRFLHPPRRQPARRSPGDSGGSSRYYADSSEEPGRWLGARAGHARLHAPSMRTILPLCCPAAISVPITGSLPPKARPVAGPSSVVEGSTRAGSSREALYDETECRSRPGRDHGEVCRMIDLGTGIALPHLVPIPIAFPNRFPITFPNPHPPWPQRRTSSRWSTPATVGSPRRSCPARTPGTNASLAVIASVGAGSDGFLIADAAPTEWGRVRSKSHRWAHVGDLLSRATGSPHALPSANPDTALGGHLDGHGPDYRRSAALSRTGRTPGRALSTSRAEAPPYRRVGRRRCGPP